MLQYCFFLDAATEYVQNVSGYYTEYVIGNTLMNKIY